MKDSQDWLVDITSLYSGYYAGKVTLGELYDGVDGTVRKHILQEALEIIDSQATPPFPVESKELRMLHEGGVLGYDLAKQELRNKFNDKYKED